MMSTWYFRKFWLARKLRPQIECPVGKWQNKIWITLLLVVVLEINNRKLPRENHRLGLYDKNGLNVTKQIVEISFVS